MASSIFHGAPGSFKSASATWFEVLPALRKGRLVVTNIEGILPIEEIETQLQETFPESAQLWRLSSQNEEGQKLWRNWYHWMPTGALVLIDEVQDVYPTEATFKPESCNYKHINNYKDLIPDNWYSYHYEQLEKFKPENLTSGDTDDLGRELFNEHGHIIYPKTLKECFMRHRKYNWDIIVCTPDITSVHKYIRNVSQYAYAHKYFDGLAAIPYYNRRPRIFEHNPKLDGKTPNKSSTIVWKKIPIEVHKCYKSTATGGITKGQGKNFLFSPIFAFPVTAIFLCILYWLWYFSSSPTSVETDKKPTNQNLESIKKDTSSNSNNADIQIADSNPVFLNLPYGATDIFVTGIQQVKRPERTHREYIFEFITDKYGVFSIDSYELASMGFTIQYFSPCNVVIKNSAISYRALCSPNPYDKPIEEKDDIETTSLLTSL
ncbi:zonular occludens toxin domain-containing protein [Pseudoalteromonas sp. SR43-3]|uniref:zonular occludens toxin domain-containing protein n=1 Tax=Pseudoalteromonas sp. SR43-3 TaxID=2760943 RepID=UPI0016043ADB|nr:zonular occludens toxin domain-containing protein [Pseudoalteromonas sp. SR43-3]MBB1276327.1 zona occludens toxin-like protein [Pseudoalteromonas sp. SR43-3]